MAREFAKCIEKPEQAIIPEVYHTLIIRDILHYTNDEIEHLELDEYLHVLDYCWTTYTLRRSDLPYKGEKTSGNLTPGMSRKSFIKTQYSQEKIEQWIKNQEIPKNIKKGKN